MLKSSHLSNNKAQAGKNSNNTQFKIGQCKKLVATGQVFKEIVDKLYNPLDSINRFINLALQSIEEDSQSRQFLIESKQGIRRTTILLKKLNNYAEKIEQELCELSTVNK